MHAVGERIKKRNADQFIYSPCGTKRLLPFKTFNSMKDSIALDGNFAQRVHSADSLFCNAFIGYMHSRDPKKKRGSRNLLLPAPSTEDKSR